MNALSIGHAWGAVVAVVALELCAGEGKLIFEGGVANYESAFLDRGGRVGRIARACRDPFRRIGKDTQVLIPLFRSWELQDTERGSGVLDGWYHLEGTVVQARAGGGLLLAVKRGSFEDETVFVRRYPTADRLVDGVGLTLFAKYVGPHSYSSTTGAAKTVRGFDYGEVVTGPEAEALFKTSQADAERRQREEAAKAAAMAKEHAALEEARRQAELRRKADIDKTTAEFLKARARQGSAEAQYELAVRYLEGRGVEKDRTEAKRLLIAAATQGHTKAAETLKEVLASEADK